MTETNKKNGPERPGRKKTKGRSGAKESKKPPDRYTPKQRERIHNGLRIWARVAIRSYLRQRGGVSDTGNVPIEEQD